ncbi:glycosyltransferase family 2 protein [Myxococcus llanfairpwllgwyngyllgogerychwyrndrobwllllantysiliogogogochensis]|uniref:Glycosyltransferase family 2 protein n=1 Tax=Myxococcus llanfairpwllgwyngyllgogerychwyrndrobwllllantysiliogogogochensis TaxID=2590453 RepID=A0A540X715_9BACT|nr:glycosyltransferase family 2 protein [Myxococcus llanfairpwllgwyngyllgogerychwyrndrobwllllantysiliogogogochensis]TQF17071.1 glycosyltransferase family 2 protein [Myxococcus llanfairpwllgwyngyllgogerychwyrndrobwllllantysiliogogogochensis]
MAEVFFWCAALLLAHTYFLYPLSLFVLDGAAQVAQNIRAMRGGAPRRGLAASRGPAPSVSLVVAAYNEVSCIEQKLENSLALDYPVERFEVVIGSDGSTDGTNERVLQCQDERVRLSPAPRAGKTTVLNRCIPTAKGDIVVLSDANTMIEPEAIQKLVRHFEDPEVGAVCGKLRLYNPTKQDYEESAYWSYESLIKMYEGRRGAVVGANGGLYAIRRTLFTELPPSTIVDDFVIPLRILEKGYKVAYEEEAVAHEETTEDYGKEFGRRARIAAGNFQSLRMVPGLLLPTAGFPAFAFWSHKLLRWCAPALMGLALIANLFLLDSVFYRFTLLGQGLFYALAYLGKVGVLKRGAAKRVASVAYYFVTMNLAIVVGFWRFLRNSQRAAWDRTARAS